MTTETEMINAREKLGFQEFLETHLGSVTDATLATSFKVHRNTIKNWEGDPAQKGKGGEPSEEASIFRRLAVIAKIQSERNAESKALVSSISELLDKLSRIQALQKEKSDVKREVREFQDALRDIADNKMQDGLGFAFPETDLFEIESVLSENRNEIDPVAMETAISRRLREKSDGYSNASDKKDMDTQQMGFPFEILYLADAPSRLKVAETLGVGLSEDEADNPSPAARKIITANMWGLQAQGNTFFESLLSRENVSYRQLLIRVIAAFDGEVPGDEKGTDVVQKIAAEAVAKKLCENLEAKDPELTKKAEEVVNDKHFEDFIGKYSNIAGGIDPTSYIAKLMAQGVVRSALSNFGTYIMAVKVAAWMNSSLGTGIAMSAATTLTSTVLKSTFVFLWAWLAVDVMRIFLKQDLNKAGAAVLQLYFLWLEQEVLRQGTRAKKLEYSKELS